MNRRVLKGHTPNRSGKVGCVGGRACSAPPIVHEYVDGHYSGGSWCAEHHPILKHIRIPGVHKE